MDQFRVKFTARCDSATPNNGINRSIFTRRISKQDEVILGNLLKSWGAPTVGLFYWIEIYPAFPTERNEARNEALLPDGIPLMHRVREFFRRQYSPPWAEIIATQALILERIEQMAKTVEDMIVEANNVLAQVTKNTDLDNSIIALMTAQAATLADLKAQLAAAGTDTVKLAALGDTLQALSDKAAAEGQLTADAIKANTPAAQEPIRQDAG